MNYRYISILLSLVLVCLPVVVAVPPGQITQEIFEAEFRQVTVYAPAVASVGNGYIGVISTITVTLQSNGTGRVFVDTLPLTQIDMQGSARLAVKVASAFVENDETCNVSTDAYDFFFVVRTDAPIIGGPSAGAVMTVATIALLENWDIDNQTIMTGMINPDGSIGPVGGIVQKIDAAYSVGATRFLIPKGQETYTETVTETTVEEGRTIIVSRPVTKNVSDYAEINYDMDVAEVEDINDALLYMTGYEFSVPEGNDSISTVNYTKSMKPLASGLLDQAQSYYENASAAFDNASIPNRWPFYYKNQISESLNDAEQRLWESEEWYHNEVYYTSTSKSFQSLINAQYVLFTCEYFSSTDSSSYVQEVLDEAESSYDQAHDIAVNTPINGLLSLQGVGAAQARVSEAYGYLSEAQSSYQSSDYLNALYQAAFCIQRSDSAGWWVNITAQFNDTGTINASVLEDLAEEYINDAQQSITYSSVIVQEMGASSSHINTAEALLSSAQDNLDEGYPAAAIFEALESLVHANLALELVDGTSQDKVDRAQQSASASITESRQRGVEPVLAVSYYEYAQSLANESAIEDALVYYKYSDFIAGVLELSTSCEGQRSRYVGIPDVVTPSMWDRMMQYSLYFFLFFLISGVAGFSIGAVLHSMTKNKQRQQQQQWMPRSIEDYYKKHK